MGVCVCVYYTYNRFKKTIIFFNGSSVLFFFFFYRYPGLILSVFTRVVGPNVYCIFLFSRQIMSVRIISIYIHFRCSKIINRRIRGDVHSLFDASRTHVLLVPLICKRANSKKKKIKEICTHCIYLQRR